MSENQILHLIGNHQCEKEKVNNLLNKIIIKQIACGYYHSIILDQNKNIYTFGRNNDGQLGLGHNNEMKYFEQVNCSQFNNEIKLIGAGGYFTTVITLQNQIYITGKWFVKSTDWSRLNSTSTKIFTKIEKPDNIIGNITKVKCGSGNIILMNENKELFGCGANTFSLLGLDAKEIGNNFLKLNLPVDSKVKDFNCSYGFSTVLMENGDIYCSGTCLFKNYRSFTKLQINCRFKQIASIYGCLYCLTDNNELYFKSNNLDLQKININCHIKKIYSGLGYFLYFIDENNNIYTVDKTEVQIEEKIYNLPYLSIYPGHDFAIFLNSNIKINDDGCVLEESKEEKRMKMLLFDNDDKMNDIKIMFY